MMVAPEEGRRLEGPTSKHSTSEVSVKNTIDVKANGEASRMRSHKGNMPSLPQTKYCALCPAKFTRTTHLNRHLRSHTNERAHRCNICNAEFTRSDLLTRHKRTCGDSSNANRSRRKSCQACAESKVKCNLQQPCSKCSSRGRECVFINDPEASRNRKLAKKAALASQMSAVVDSSQSPITAPSLGPSSPTSSATSGPASGHPRVVPSQLGIEDEAGPSGSFQGLSGTSDCSSVSSSHSSPRLDFFEQSQDSKTFNSNFGTTLRLDSDMSDFFSNILDPLISDSPCLPRTYTEADLPTWFETVQSTAGYGHNEPNLYNLPLCQPNDHSFLPSLTNLNRNSSTSGKSSFSGHHFSTNQSLHTPPLHSSSAPRVPIPEELNSYLYLFFTEYNAQVPLFHRPTWKHENAHPLLISAMQACGALLVKTQSAMEFTIKVLTSLQDVLIAEFSKPTGALKDRMDLVLAVVLLQSIFMIHPRPEQKTLSKTYHDILVMMIRQIGLIQFIDSWEPPELSLHQVMESAWNDWARYETFKRALALAFVLDCIYCFYYAASPAFSSAEFNINLPCDDELWKAQNYRDWYHAQSLFSPYGTGKPRLLGVNMQLALATLAEPVTSAITFTVNAFSAFILVHSILKDIFVNQRTTRLPLISDGSSVAIQRSLHNWQRMWASCTESTVIERNSHDVPFVFNAMPFYWLARFADGEKHSEVPVSDLRGSQFSGVEGQDRYRVVKGWLGQINATLRRGSQMTSIMGSNAIGTMGFTAFSHGS